ncbi:MAG: hypothetical protein M3R69_11150 [Acidobacteriota bacterium]|nr:hypothetical protein [Acidobacteriota bacterium]
MALWLLEFGSVVADDAVAVLVSTVPPGTEDATATVNVKTTLPGACDGFEQDTAPPAPTAGTVHDQPLGDDNDTKVVPAGSVSDNETEAALLGPALFTVIV